MITALEVQAWRDCGVGPAGIVRRVCRPGVLTEDQIVAWMDIVVTRIACSHALPWSLHVVEEYSPCAHRFLRGEDLSVEHVMMMATRMYSESASSRVSEETWEIARIEGFSEVKAACMVADKSLQASRVAWVTERERQVLDLLGVLMSDGAGQ